MKNKIIIILIEKFCIELRKNVRGNLWIKQLRNFYKKYTPIIIRLKKLIMINFYIDQICGQFRDTKKGNL